MISVIVCSRDDARFDTFERKLAKSLGAEPYELIRIPDATGMAEGYNRGLRKSAGQFVIFCHDDIELIGDETPERIRSYLGAYDAIGVAGTDRLVSPRWGDAGHPHTFGQVAHTADWGFNICIYGAPKRAIGGMQALDGLFLAFKREVILRVGWDEQSFAGFHCYDVDTTYRAYRMGYQLAVVCDLPIVHASGGVYDEVWAKDARTFMSKHGAGLPKPYALPHTITTVHVRTKLEALEVLSPRYFDE